jgi:dephospho-CoA kinase
MIVGLTGGIGSGKTTVANMFTAFNIPVFIADKEAKELMLTSNIEKQIVSLLGNESYKDGKPNNAFIAKQVFKDKATLSKLNNIIHPAVRRYFIQWYKEQHAPYVIQEAAILFESGGYKVCDAIILVTAPLNVRIDRVIKRDSVTEEAVLNRVNNQWLDKDKIPLSDYVINNIDLKTTQEQVEEIHNQLVKKSKRIDKF